MFRVTFSNPNVAVVFDNHNCTHAEFEQLLRDRAKGALQGQSDVEADKKIRTVFNEICGLPADNTDAKLARQAVRRHRIDIFEVVENVLPDLVISGWNNDPFFNAYVDFRNEAAGDDIVYTTEDKTILNVSRVSGDHWDIKRQRLGAGERFTVPYETYAVGIYAEFARLMIGAEKWADLVAKVAQAFTKKINDTIYSQYVNAPNSLPAGSQWKKTLTLSSADDSRNALLTLVEDVETAAGAPAAITGTKTALGKLRQIGETQWISNEMKQELYTTGRLGYFEGVRLIEIPQAFAANTTTRMIDPTAASLMVMPLVDNKFIKFTYSGDAEIKETTDNTVNQDMTNEYYFIQKYGIGTVINMLFGSVTLA